MGDKVKLTDEAQAGLARLPLDLQDELDQQLEGIANDPGISGGEKKGSVQKIYTRWLATFYRILA